jgi:RNA ligase (TIGR02306 family)
MKLATIEKITGIIPILGADKIVLANVLGWSVIVKKDEYKVGDYGIYIPIDTMVNPKQNCFSFLMNKNNPDEWIRIKTLKMKGVFSQGLLIPITSISKKDYKEGDDVSQFLEIKKYEKENIIVANGTTTHFEAFPTDIIPITDEDNLKTYNHVLSEFYGEDVYITIKMDGSSMTVIRKNDDFKVCSRRLVLDEGAVMYQYVLREGLKERLKENVAIQGEFCGPKVNGNQMGLKDYKFYVFTVRNLDTRQYLSFEEIQLFCEKYKLEMVPLINRCVLAEDTSLQSLQELTNTVEYTHPNNKKVPGEGIVIRPVIPLYSVKLEKNLSVKLINQNYKD